MNGKKASNVANKHCGNSKPPVSKAETSDLACQYGDLIII